MTLEVVQEILFADSPILMSHVPYHRRTVINDAFDGEVAHNLADGLRGIDVNPIHIRACECPLAVLILLLTIKDKLAEVWSDGHNYVHSYLHVWFEECTNLYSKYFFMS